MPDEERENAQQERPGQVFDVQDVRESHFAAIGACDSERN
jgi:hypothetical protein